MWYVFCVPNNVSISLAHGKIYWSLTKLAIPSPSFLSSVRLLENVLGTVITSPRHSRTALCWWLAVLPVLNNKWRWKILNFPQPTTRRERKSSWKIPNERRRKKRVKSSGKSQCVECRFFDSREIILASCLTIGSPSSLPSFEDRERGEHPLNQGFRS